MVGPKEAASRAETEQGWRLITNRRGNSAEKRTVRRTEKTKDGPESVEGKR